MLGHGAYDPETLGDRQLYAGWAAGPRGLLACVVTMWSFDIELARIRARIVTQQHWLFRTLVLDACTARSWRGGTRRCPTPWPRAPALLRATATAPCQGRVRKGSAAAGQHAVQRRAFAFSGRRLCEAAEGGTYGSSDFVEKRARARRSGLGVRARSELLGSFLPVGAYVARAGCRRATRKVVSAYSANGSWKTTEGRDWRAPENCGVKQRGSGDAWWDEESG